MLDVKGIDIFGINGINDLKIVFEPGINIICGRNGVGKTTILECIATGITNKKNNKLSKNLSSSEGYYFIYGYNDYDPFSQERYLDTKNNNRHTRKISNNLLYFTIHRTQSNSFKMKSIQKWFGEMFEKNQLAISEYDDLQLAIECFQKLDPNIKFSRVIFKNSNKDKSFNPRYYNNEFIETDAEILVSTLEGEIPLSYLSAGYLSCLSIFLEIIKKATDVDFNQPIREYDGLILIDEIDLHLHPEWQKKILEILRWMVPNAQIIATTHSPHIVQVTQANEVITIKNNYGLCFAQRNNANLEYGYQGWSIEEILEDVMGLKNTHSDLYNELIESIKYSIDHLEIDNAQYNLEELKRLLHPNNPLGKILSIQIATMRGNL
ncbi:AAA family ATPase [Lysinibacillus sp. RS5]|uniref:AAA family ATPase n=1 Tax=unclassified Lysinibacillus TaxID=2636778 RepID=UPI0035BEA236